MKYTFVLFQIRKEWSH